ncbi:MAG: S1C family serine protease, partial [Candidatus Poribacteria bacterium]|nr:S1C family serine protease [Candidatus Poribacteria bacterium]
MSHKFRYIIYTFSLFLCLAVVCIGKNANVQQELSGSRENAIVKAVEYASPAVVNISTTRIQEYTVNPFFQDLWSPFFDMPFQIPQKRELHGLGSGIIISGDGYILTNQHVIEDADFVEIILFDGQEFEAQ